MPYDSTEPPPSDTTKELVSYCATRGWGIIKGSDVNSHNSVWNSTDTNLRGEYLLYYILGTNLTICNCGSETMFAISTREEVIDLTLTSRNMEQYMKKWRVNQEYAHSDHKLITFKVHTKKTEKSTIQKHKENILDRI